MAIDPSVLRARASRTRPSRLALHRRGLGLAAAALLSGALLAGCSGGSSERSDPLPAASETPELYQRVLIDSPGRADHGRHIGYVGNAVLTTEEHEHSVTRVYDPNFRILGFFLGNGACYQLTVDRSGREVEHSLGNHEPAECIERICRVDGPFKLEKGP